MPILQQILSTVQADGQHIKDSLHNIETYSRALFNNARIHPSTLSLRIPAVPTFSASSPPASVVSTTNTSASSSSAVYVSRMPHVVPPSAGPSGSGSGSLRCKLSQIKPYSVVRQCLCTCSASPPCWWKDKAVTLEAAQPFEIKVFFSHTHVVMRSFLLQFEFILIAPLIRQDTLCRCIIPALVLAEIWNRMICGG